MIGLGTIINTGAIVAGGLFGLLFGKNMKERIQDTLPWRQPLFPGLRKFITGNSFQQK